MDSKELERNLKPKDKLNHRHNLKRKRNPKVKRILNLLLDN
jgi:hypothetical protein